MGYYPRILRNVKAEKHQQVMPITSPSPLPEIATHIFTQALADCALDRAFTAKLQPTGPFSFTLCGSPDQPPAHVDLTAISRVLVIAAGKGAAPMLAAFLRDIPLPPACTLSGILVAPQPLPDLPSTIEFFPGGHPMPNRASFAAAHTALTLIRAADPATTFCFFLISGGASAMMELPFDPAISLDDTIALNRALVHSGASIAEINCVRKHFSAIKGGRLGHAAASIPNLSILVSDVPAGHLDALSSGPTVPDPSTIADCRSILSRSKLLPQLPPAVRDFFTNPELPETPKPDSFSPQVITLLSDHDLANSASILAESHGFTAFIDTSCDDLDYRIAAERLLTRFRALRREHRKVCLIAPGEVTVQLPTQKIPNTQGGRNQHFALYAATLLTPEDGNTTIFSAGSDGIDGNSPFAGAVLDYDTLHTASPTAAIEALNNFDSSTFLHTLNATLTTGPTGNNLRDLRLFLAD